MIQRRGSSDISELDCAASLISLTSLPVLALQWVDLCEGTLGMLHLVDIEGCQDRFPTITTTRRHLTLS